MLIILNLILILSLFKTCLGFNQIGTVWSEVDINRKTIMENLLNDNHSNSNSRLWIDKDLETISMQMKIHLLNIDLCKWISITSQRERKLKIKHKWSRSKWFINIKAINLRLDQMITNLVLSQLVNNKLLIDLRSTLFLKRWYHKWIIDKVKHKTGYMRDIKRNSNNESIKKIRGLKKPKKMPTQRFLNRARSYQLRCRFRINLSKRDW